MFANISRSPSEGSGPDPAQKRIADFKPQEIGVIKVAASTYPAAAVDFVDTLLLVIHLHEDSGAEKVSAAFKVWHNPEYRFWIRNIIETHGLGARLSLSVHTHTDAPDFEIANDLIKDFPAIYKQDNLKWRAPLEPYSLGKHNQVLTDRTIAATPALEPSLRSRQTQLLSDYSTPTFLIYAAAVQTHMKNLLAGIQLAFNSSPPPEFAEHIKQVHILDDLGVMVSAPGLDTRTSMYEPPILAFSSDFSGRILLRTELLANTALLANVLRQVLEQSKLNCTPAIIQQRPPHQIPIWQATQ